VALTDFSQLTRLEFDGFGRVERSTQAAALSIPAANRANCRRVGVSNFDPAGRRVLPQQ